MSERESLIKAGKIAADVRTRIVPEVKSGVRYIDICERVESMIRQAGAAPGFPCNVDVDSVAAHYASPTGDQHVVAEGQLVKVDIGVHVDGYIADTAVTVCLDPELQPMVRAAEDALEVACRAAKPGARASDIGSTIEHIIRNRGMKPIRNLTGHKLARYIVHAGRSIPNVGGFELHKLEEGEVYAIEPFAVLPSAAGEVRDGPPSNIYRFLKKRSVTNSTSKRMLETITEEYRTLPFASRWLVQKYPGPDGQRAFQELLRAKCIEGYPQLVERTGAKVAQAEHTIIVTADGGLVTTKL